MEKNNNLNILITKVNDKDNNSLKNILDNLANKYENIFILIANINNNMITFISRSNSNLNSGEIVKKVASQTNGNGGGSNKFAMGSGKDITNIDNILSNLKKELNG